MNRKYVILFFSIFSFFLLGITRAPAYADAPNNPANLCITDKNVTNSKTFLIKKGSTIIFNIKKLSDIFGYNLVITGSSDIEILRDKNISLSNYQHSLSALIKGYPVHVDLYEANRVAVVSILSSLSH